MHHERLRSLSEQETSLVAAYIATFIAHCDCYPLQQPDGSYLTWYQPLESSLIARHLKGQITLGTYALDEQGIVSYRETSRRGGHLWLFTPPLPGLLARRFGQTLLARHDLPQGEPYANVHCYRNFLAEPGASSFELTLSFWFSPTTCSNQNAPSTVQALEFSMSKWEAGQRYEVALQWQNVGEGAPQWRYWDPSQPDRWVPVQTEVISRCLQGSTWHTLTLNGEIIDQAVHYQSFTLDGQMCPLDMSAPSVTEGVDDKLAIAVPLDGNSTGTPYDVFIDNVVFRRNAPVTPEILVTTSANLRSCASQRCSTLTGLSKGEVIPLVAINENGECINDNCVWYETDFFGSQAFIHSSVATISGSPLPQSEASCVETGERTIEFSFNVPDGYNAYIGSNGVGINPQNMRYGRLFTTITGPFERTLYINNGVYCTAAAIGSANESTAWKTMQDACTGKECKALNLPQDLASIGG
ncbi:MAG: hypothetical protein K8L99_09300 [Anaerolineae bacterium]|nr:hypothetical protein [Anaerolineae bacterium]